MTLKTKPPQTFTGILIRQVEIALKIFSGCFLHVQLIGILLVEEANFLPGEKKKRGKLGETSLQQPLKLNSHHSHLPQLALQGAICHSETF